MSLDRTIAPPIADFGKIKLAEIETSRLNSGAELNILNGGEQPLTRLILLWEIGADDTPVDKLPSIVSEVMREGSANFTGAEIADRIDFAGARIGSRQSGHHIGLEVIALNKKLYDLTPVISDIVTAPVFNSDAIAMVAKKTATGIAVQQAKVSYGVQQYISDVMAGRNHPATYHDTPQSVMSITRDNVIDFYNKSYRKGRLYAFVAGQIDDSLAAHLEKFVSSLPCGTEKCYDIIPFRPESPSQHHIPYPEAKQSAISMSIPTINRSHPDYVDLRLAVIALGGYFSSRLMSNIREDKGLTYDISSSVLGLPEGAYINIEAQCDASYIEQVIAETKREIADIALNPPTGEELHRLKQYVWLSLAASADSVLSTIDNYTSHLTIATPKTYFADQLKAVEQITPERIAQIARRYLNPDNLHICTAGPA